ncbi:hypothetical protein BX600DRAFT_474824 [Xylariales sp. PMI_506]|nr:hypothetical protein BX600DRAFT_474824 [Xylariales sp. PMI_506]
MLNDHVIDMECGTMNWRAQNGGPSLTTVLSSLLIVLLTLIIEPTAHAFKAARSKFEALPTISTSQATEEASTHDSPPALGQGEAIPSPICRASRLSATTIIIIPVCVAFGLRMGELYPAQPSGACYGRINYPPPDWFAISIINVLPLTCACTAWLRCVVDCVLIRYGGHLPLWYWPPVLPIGGTALLLMSVCRVLRDAILWVVMGRPQGSWPSLTGFSASAATTTAVGNDGSIPLSIRRGEDTEMAGNSELAERQGLMKEEIDSNGDDDDYDERTMYSPRGSDDGKHINQDGGV